MHRSGRRYLMAGGLVLAAALLATACSQRTRYRVLRFFFDGVPDPNRPVQVAETTTQPSDAAATQPAEQEKPRLLAHAHPLYRDNRCDQCHDMLGGGLVRTVSEGLCNMCHPQPPPGTEYIHRPVAENDCLECHHYHASAYRKILLDDPAALCFKCHERDELSRAAHTPAADRRACLDCHDPHGGADRFHLRNIDQ